MTTLHRCHLPHLYVIGQPIFITWRLHGSLPINRSFPTATNSGQAFLVMDRLLDTATTGPLFLRRPDIACVVRDSIRYRDRDLRHYELHAFVVKPNDVHLLMTPLMEVSKVMQSLKRFTAREGNRILGVTGQAFWQVESYDRLVRNETEFERIRNYIEMNPVKAGWAVAADKFPWSSASAD